MRFQGVIGLIGSRGAIWSIFNGYTRFRVEHVKILCPTNVETFYKPNKNLQFAKVWIKIDMELQWIRCTSWLKWGVFVLVKIGSRLVHSITPNEKE